VKVVSLPSCSRIIIVSAAVLCSPAVTKIVFFVLLFGIFSIEILELNFNPSLS
jgi:hypothetical protein